MSVNTSSLIAQQETQLGPDCLVYEPQTREIRGTIVTVHGVTRQHTEQFESLKPLAEALGCRLLAPYFSAEAFPDYQRLGRRGRGPRADLALLGLIDRLGVEPTEPLFMLGFSGGAQFAHRFVFAHPQRVAGAVIISAGFYTMIDPCRAYPYGLRVGRRLPGTRMNADSFLRVPTLTLVGDRDTQSDRHLRSTPRLNARQGATRLRRAQTWHEELVKCCDALQISGRHEFAVVTGVGHDCAGIVASQQSAITVFLERCFEDGSCRA